MLSNEAASLVAAARGLAPQIRAAADAIERERCLPPWLVQALAEAGFFRMVLPRALGGLEVDILTMPRVVEELARADASVAWCVMTGAQSASLAAHLLQEGADEIFGRDP